MKLNTLKKKKPPASHAREKLASARKQDTQPLANPALSTPN